MKIALCQSDIKYEDKEHNIINVKKNVVKSSQMGAQAVFFPEMTLTGFSMNVALIAETDNETPKLMKALAMENDTAIGFGWVRSKNGKGENHYTVVDKNGTVLADYVKIHPFSYGGENLYYEPGNRVVTFELDGVTFSVFICYDLRFPEIFQIASEKAEVIVVAANWPQVRISHWTKLLEARAIENQCWILGVNCFGWQNNEYYSGGSRIAAPTGETRAFLEHESGLLFCEIKDEAAQYRKSFPMKRDRDVSKFLVRNA